MSATLHRIKANRSTSFAESMLRELVPSLQQSERTSTDLRRMIAEQGRKLAQERGVAFIRLEHLLREFGK